MTQSFDRASIRHLPLDQSGNLRATRPLRRRRLGPPQPARTIASRERRVTGGLGRAERRLSHFLARHVLPAVLGLSAFYDWQLRTGLTLVEGEVRLRGLPAAWSGVRVLLISDPHAGPFVSPAALHETFRRLLLTEPDLVLLGGDVVACGVHELHHHRRAFACLEAPLGAFAVLGNHDHYDGEAGALRTELASLGLRVLDNENVELERRGDPLVLAGIDDWTTGEPDLAAALSTARTAPVLLLSHNPDAFFEAARGGADLVLAGHTHGGQVRLPGLGAPITMSRYRLSDGHYTFAPAGRSEPSQLIVSRGIGVVGLPLRLACPPEALLLTLRN